MADALEAATTALVAENARDLAAGEGEGLSRAMLDRLMLARPLAMRFPIISRRQENDSLPEDVSMIIFLDESGDLGFDFSKSKTSRKFVITLLVCENMEAMAGLRRGVRRTLKNKLNAKKNRSQELKGTNTTLPVKEYFYRHLSSGGWQIYSVILNKQRVYENLRTKLGKKKLYNFLARFLLEKVDLSRTGTTVNLVLDKCKNKEEIKDFNTYVENQLQGLLPLDVPLFITHEFSHNNPGLQAVDLFCWGIYRKHEVCDEEWYRVYQSTIAYEGEYLK